MNKQESKYFSTAILMDEALIHLLEKKDIEYIRAKEICEKAGVNRSTFYLHYESVDDLLEESMKYINNKFVSYFDENTSEFINKIQDSSPEDLNLITEKYLTPYLNFVKENKKIFRASFNNPKGMKAFDSYNDLEKNVLIPILRRYNISEKEMKYILKFYIQGIIAIVKEWVNNNCNESVEVIEKIIIKCSKKVNIDEKDKIFE